MSAEVELRMLEGSEFQTMGAAMLKPREGCKGCADMWNPQQIGVSNQLG